MAASKEIFFFVVASCCAIFNFRANCTESLLLFFVFSLCLSSFSLMFLWRLLYAKGCTIDELMHSELWKKCIQEFGSATTPFGCVLFLKDDIMEFLRDEENESHSLCGNGDLLAVVLQWARGGRRLQSEHLAVHAVRASSSFPFVSLGPWSVIEQCMGDPCSFGVIAGFVSRCVHDGSHNDGHRERHQSLIDGLLWEWEELINCTTLSQLSLYVDSPLSAGGMKAP